MPQIQIIRKEVDPSAEMLSQAGQGIADTMQKAQAMRLTGEYYKILKKHADTEEANAKYERLIKANNVYEDIANTRDPNLKATKIEALHTSLYGGDSQQAFHDQATLGEQWAKQASKLQDSQPSGAHDQEFQTKQLGLDYQKVLQGAMLKRLGIGNQAPGQQPQALQDPSQGALATQNNYGLPPVGANPMSTVNPNLAAIQAIQGGQSSAPIAPPQVPIDSSQQQDPNAGIDNSAMSGLLQTNFKTPYGDFEDPQAAALLEQSKAEGKARGEAGSPKVAPEQTSELRNIQDAQDLLGNAEDLASKVKATGQVSGRLAAAANLASSGKVNRNLGDYMQMRDELAKKVWMATNGATTWRPSNLPMARELVWNPLTQDKSLAPGMFAANKAALKSRAAAAGTVATLNPVTSRIRALNPQSPAGQELAKNGGDVRAQYNALRKSGLNAEKAKKQLGL